MLRASFGRAALAAPVILTLAGGELAAQGERATSIGAGETCPPGTTEIRPRSCLGPAGPVPSILDYRPRSTLVVPSHPVPRAKYPVIDFHGHPRGRLESVDSLARLGAELDALNVRLMVDAGNTSGDALRRTVATIAASREMKDGVRVLTGIDFRGVGPGWAERAVAQLEADVALGAVGIGEIGKAFGQTIRKADGSRLALDDPDLDPIWAAAARLGLPVFIHTGDPQEFYQPHDYRNERWLELALFPRRHIGPEGRPTFEQLMRERDNLFRRNPRTIFVAAHMGWHANDLERLSRMLDEMPNLYVEVGAILYDLGRQPRAAHDFFVRYQDRILFGKDSYQPDEVLKKVYYRNALRIAPRLPQGGWPR